MTFEEVTQLYGKLQEVIHMAKRIEPYRTNVDYPIYLSNMVNSDQPPSDQWQTATTTSAGPNIRVR